MAAVGLGLIVVGLLLPRRWGDAPVDSPRTVLTVLAGLVTLGVAMLAIPSHVATLRRHPSKDAIGLLSLVGIVFPPLWIAALVWAHSVPAPARD